MTFTQELLYNRSMKERFEYFIIDKKLFALDTSSHFIVYFENGEWHEECNINESIVIASESIDEAEAMKITNDVSPLDYVEELIEQDMYKNIYCP